MRHSFAVATLYDIALHILDNLAGLAVNIGRPYCPNAGGRRITRRHLRSECDWKPLMKPFDAWAEKLNSESEQSKELADNLPCSRINLTKNSLNKS